MNKKSVHVRELAAWGLDTYSYRPKTYHPKSRTLPIRCDHVSPSNVVLEQYTNDVQHLLHPQSLRSDLLEEMNGLQWSLGVIDIRALIAFQRRLFFDPDIPPAPIPAAHNWEDLIGLTFRPLSSPQYTCVKNVNTNVITIESTNPNVHIRTSSDASSPLRIHAGGPFFEVATLRNRWFLRDGYHRAYSLLCAGVYEVPAVIVHAKTLEELGATQSWFFSEEILFSDSPPLVSDFVDESMVINYNRPPLIKTIRITIKESLSTLSPTGEQL